MNSIPTLVAHRYGSVLLMENVLQFDSVQKEFKNRRTVLFLIGSRQVKEWMKNK